MFATGMNGPVTNIPLVNAGQPGAFMPELLHPVHQFSARTIDFSSRVALMAIINRTPNSFYDAGTTFGLPAAVDAALKAVDDGADWVDIGGVPFAPGPTLSPKDEAERIVPVIAAVRNAADVVISADTFDPYVAQRAIDAGADVINDTTGLQNLDLARVVADTGVHLVITHSLAAPRTVYPRPRYGDVVAEVAEFLQDRVNAALDLGVAPENIIIDPGHDLNKNTLHSLELTRRFHEIAALGYPALAAVSNKDFIGETLGQPKADRLEGSLAAAVMCILGGARIVRMHDVGASRSTIDFTETALGWRQPSYLEHNMGDTNRPTP